MSQPYIIRRDGVDYHAPDLDTLRRWAQEGRVHPTDLIYSPTFHAWYRAHDLRALRDVLPAVAAAPPPAMARSQQCFWLRKGENNYRADDLETVLRWAEDGNIEPDDFIFHPSYGKWFRAGDSPQLASRFPAHIQSQPPFLPASADPMGSPAVAADAPGSDEGGVTRPDLQSVSAQRRAAGGRAGTGVESADSVAKTVMDLRAVDVIRALEAERAAARPGVPGDGAARPTFAQVSVTDRTYPGAARPTGALARPAMPAGEAARPAVGARPTPEAARAAADEARTVPDLTRAAEAARSAPEAARPAAEAARPAPEVARPAAEAARPAPEAARPAAEAARPAPELPRTGPAPGAAIHRPRTGSMAAVDPDAAARPRTGSIATADPRVEPSPAPTPERARSVAAPADEAPSRPAPAAQAVAAAVVPDTSRPSTPASVAPSVRPAVPPSDAPAVRPPVPAGDAASARPVPESPTADAPSAPEAAAAPAGPAPADDVRFTDRLGLMKPFYDAARVFVVTRDLRPGELLETSCRMPGVVDDFLGTAKRAIYHRVTDVLQGHLERVVRPARAEMRPDELPGFERMLDRAEQFVGILDGARDLIGKKPPERVVIGNQGRPKMTPEEEQVVQRLDKALKALISVKAKG